MRYSILSLFPDYFNTPLKQSILKRAQEKGLIEIELIDQASRLVDQKWVEMAMIRFLAFPGGNAPFVEFMHPKLNPKVDYRGFTIQLQKFDEKKHTGVFKVTKQKRRMA